MYILELIFQSGFKRKSSFRNNWTQEFRFQAQFSFFPAPLPFVCHGFPPHCLCSSPSGSPRVQQTWLPVPYRLMVLLGTNAQCKWKVIEGKHNHNESICVGVCLFLGLSRNGFGHPLLQLICLPLCPEPYGTLTNSVLSLPGGQSPMGKGRGRSVKTATAAGMKLSWQRAGLACTKAC